MEAQHALLRKKLRKIATLVTGLFVLSAYLSGSVFAATGINQTINFQGKVVNTNGTNVSDGNYNMIFELYDASAAGTQLWTETWNSGTSQVSVTDGIFRVALGTYSSMSSVDFNQDNLWLKVTFNGEVMSPRIRFTAVPYAFEAKRVAGLTVTNNGGNTLNIAANKTLKVDNTITLTAPDGNTYTFGTPASGSSDTIPTLTSTSTLTNKTIGSTGLTFSGATTDITTGTNEAFTIAPNGTGAVQITSGVTSGTGTSSGLSLVASSLTSGTGLNVSSAATALTGMLTNIELTSSNAGNTGTLFRVGAAATNAVTTAMITNLGTGNSFRVNDQTGDTDTTPFLIDASGNVGIGFTSPGTKLTVGGGLAVGTTSITSTYLTKAAPDGGAIFEGNVGIGTTSPSARLDIIDSASKTADYYDLKIADTSNWGTLSSVKNAYGININATPTISENASSDYYHYGTYSKVSSSAITLNSSATNYIDNHIYGNYSWITANPIFNDASGVGTSNYNAAGIETLLNGSPTLTNAAGSVMNTYGASFKNRATSGGASGLAYNNYGLYVLTDGSLTTTGTTTKYGGYFDVSGTTDTSYGLYVNESGGATNYGIYLGGPSSGSTNWALYSSASAQSYFAGSVGIGTTAPSAKLEVAGTFSQTGANTFSTGTGTVSLNGDAVIASGKYLRLVGGAGDPTATSGIMWYDTTANKFKIVENGAVKVMCNTTDGGCGAGGSTKWNTIQNPDGNAALTMAAYTTTLTYNATTSTNNLFNLTDSASNTGTGYLLNLVTASSSTLKPFRVNAAGTEALMVNASGNVGIGTTVPNAKLDILYTSGAQARFSYDTSNYATITTGSNGLTTMTTAGSNAGLTFSTGANNGAISFMPNGTGSVIFTSGVTTGNSTTTSGVVLTANSLQSGNGLYVYSNSTGFSSGTLSGLEWSPSSSTTATGDLFAITLGSNGNVGYLFNVKDGTTSLFNISETQISSNLPHAFTAAGDVGLAYDMIFTNQTSSNIKSYGPLTIESGESFESNDLTFRTFNSGNINLDVAELTGGVSIGTNINPVGKFHVEGKKVGKALAIFNDTGDQDVLVASASGNTIFVADRTHVAIGDGTGAGDATTLRLDVKTDSGDPTGVNGAIYYNSNLKKFRCYENGAWKDCAGRSKTVLSGDVINNNAVANTIADVTGLSFPVVNGNTYHFKFIIFYSSAATATGSRWTINGPATTNLAYTSHYSLTATTETINYANAYNIPAASNATSANTTGNIAIIEGVITPSADGTVIARFASEVSSSAITAKAGSMVEYWAN